LATIVSEKAASIGSLLNVPCPASIEHVIYRFERLARERPWLAAIVAAVLIGALFGFVLNPILGHGRSNGDMGIAAGIASFLVLFGVYHTHSRTH